MRFDLLVKGGEVVDQASGFSGRLDVAVKRDRVVAIDRDIPNESAFRVVDAGGQYVTPGLVDLHTHVFHGMGYFSINPNPIASQTGVTSWADAGSAGALTLSGFREHVVDRSRLKILSYVNIACTGLVSQNCELSISELCNIDLLRRVVNQNRDIVVGIKLRAGRSGGARNSVPYERARRAADEMELPLMVHISTAPPDIATVLQYLRPGDILTHVFTGQNMRLIDEEGRVLSAAKKAVESGIILDLGHGAGSFSFHTAEAMFSQGYRPDVISSDLHWMSVYGPALILDDPTNGLVFARRETEDDPSISIRIKRGAKPSFNLLTCIDKMLFLGMSFPDIIRATTSTPASILGLKGEVGTLKPGARADIATFVIDKADVELRDIHGQVRHGSQCIRNTMTILGGIPFERMEMGAPPPWVQFVEAG